MTDKDDNEREDKDAGKHTPSDVPTLLNIYREVHPASTIVRLLEKQALGVWTSKVLSSHVVFIRADIKEIEDAINELGRETYRLNTEGRCLNGMSFETADKVGSPYYVIAVSGEGTGIIPVIAHEAVHTAVHILNDHRVPLDTELESETYGETLAYLTESLVEFGIKTFLPELKLPQILDPLETLLVVDHNKNN